MTSSYHVVGSGIPVPDLPAPPKPQDVSGDAPVNPPPETPDDVPLELPETPDRDAPLDSPEREQPSEPVSKPGQAPRHAADHGDVDKSLQGLR